MNTGSSQAPIHTTADLHRRLECLEALLVSAPLGLGLLDPDCRYRWVSPMLASINGRPAGDPIGRMVREIRPDQADLLEPLLRELLDGGKASAAFVLAGSGTASPGDPPLWEGNFHLLRSSGGDLLGIAMTVEPRRGEPGGMERARNEPPIELDRQQYRFLETLAHELKNPLTPILSAAQMLQRYGAQKPEVLEWAGANIERQVRQISSAVNDLMDLARAELGELELHKTPLDLTPLLEATIESCRRLAGESGQTVHVSLPTRQLWVSGDAARLQQAVQHQLIGAMKSTPTGGNIEFTGTLEDGYVVLRVRDLGAGMEVGTPEAIFDPFSSVENSRLRKLRGMGVGLALARRVIALHGGTLDAFSSSFGNGSEFVARLPAALPPESDLQEPHRDGTTAPVADASIKIGAWRNGSH